MGGHDPNPRRSGRHPVAPSLIEKVRKLLAMAEGTANRNEADAFSRKAAELIAAHRIDPERLRQAVHDELGVLRWRSDAAPTCVAGWRCCKGLARRTGAAPCSRSTIAARSPSLPASAPTSRPSSCSTTRSTARRRVAWQPSDGRPPPPPSNGVDRSCSGTPSRSVRCCAPPAKRPSSACIPRAQRCPRCEPRQACGRFSRQRFGRVVAARRPKAATVTGFQAGRGGEQGRHRAGPPERVACHRARGAGGRPRAGRRLRRRGRRLRRHQLRVDHRRSTRCGRWHGSPPPDGGRRARPGVRRPRRRRLVGHLPTPR